MKVTVEKEARKKEKEIEEHQEEKTEKNIDLTEIENERTFKGACRSFVIPEIPKSDIDGYFD